MPAGYTAQRISNFGGLMTLTDATNIPYWASPNCQDVEFKPGLVKTRPGLLQAYSTLIGPNAQCNYTKTYVTVQEFVRTLCFFTGGFLSGGALYKEDVTNSPGTLSPIALNLLASRCDSTSLFQREYLAFGDGKFGVDVPRQFDDVNLDRVSKVGPGAAPSVSDQILAPFTITPTGVGPYPSPYTIATATEAGNVVTVTVTGPPGNLVPQLQIGDFVHVSGVSVGAYNGDFQISAIPSPTTFQYILGVTALAPGAGGNAQFSLFQVNTTAPTDIIAGQTAIVSGVTVSAYNGTYTVRAVISPTQILLQGGLAQDNLASSGNGTLTSSGNIIAGVHQITVMFVDREGYITAPAPPRSWTAGGSRRAAVSNIPIGPPDIVARILAFTPISSDSFFYTTGTNQTIQYSEMVINDNTTTSAIIDFTDALLEAGTNVDDLFDLVELGECSGVTSYSSRLFWWGERNKVLGFTNLTFDGGFTQSGQIYPLGWTPDPISFSGGGLAPTQVAGQAYSMTGDGVSTSIGMIEQSAAFTAFGEPLLKPGVAYSVRVRVLDGGGPGLAAGNLLEIFLFSPSIGNIQTFSLNLFTAGLSTSVFKEYSGSFVVVNATIPADTQLRVFAAGVSGPIALNQKIYIDDIEFFETNNPLNIGLIRASKAEDPESYSGIDGFLQPAPENGQRIGACFTIRNIFYMGKERSLYATQDDGVSEPSNWPIQEVSSKVGTFSVEGVGLGDEWAVIASETGFWYFTGGMITEDHKLSKEIQPTWDSINWTYGHLISVVIDQKRKKIYVSAPFGSSTIANKVLTLDYTEGFGEMQEGVGRKWCPWSINAASVALVQRQDYTNKVFFGNSNGNGRVFQLDTTGTLFYDPLSNIDSFWQSGFFQMPTRMNFGYLSGNITGFGNMLLYLVKGDLTNITQIRGWTLNSLGYQNMERTIQKQAFRLGVKLECNAAVQNQNFSVQGLDMWLTESVFAPLRGVNA